MKIRGRSKAIHSTWFYLPTYKLMFDCGEGASSTLGIHASDVEHVFISHTHLDHISGLVTLARFQQRTLKNDPNRKVFKLLYHKDCLDKLNSVKRFLKDFNVRLEFIELECGQDYQIKKNIFLRPFEVNHTAKYYRQKLMAMGCHLVERRKRLKKKYQIEKDKIDKKFKNSKEAQHEFTKLMLQVKKDKGDGFVMEDYDRIMLSYCGDSTPVDPKILKGTEILMHEVTFINKDEMEAAHSGLEDVIDVAKKVKCKALIIYHLSERYKRELANYKDVIQGIAKKKKLDCPLHIVGIDEYFRTNI